MEIIAKDCELENNIYWSYASVSVSMADPPQTRDILGKPHPRDRSAANP